MNIHELTQRREELRKHLDDHKDMRGHRTYKAVESELNLVRDKIKQHYRQEFKGTKLSNR